MFSIVCDSVIMPPTLKKFFFFFFFFEEGGGGHIAFGLSVRVSIRPSCFLMHAISFEPCMIGF